MKIQMNHLPQAFALLFSLATLGASHVAAEVESNDTSGQANAVAIPVGGTGSTTGKLRAFDTTPNPRDQDWFSITNSNAFTSIDIEVIPNGIHANEHLTFEVLTTMLTPIFQFSPFEVSGSSVTKTITSPNPGTTFFIRVYDDGNLSTLSGDCNYTVEVTGAGGGNSGLAAKQAECEKLENALKKAKAAFKKSKSARSKAKVKKATAALKQCKAELAALL